MYWIYPQNEQQADMLIGMVQKHSELSSAVYLCILYNINTRSPGVSVSPYYQVATQMYLV